MSALMVNVYMSIFIFYCKQCIILRTESCSLICSVLKQIFEIRVKLKTVSELQFVLNHACKICPSLFLSNKNEVIFVFSQFKSRLTRLLSSYFSLFHLKESGLFAIVPFKGC